MMDSDTELKILAGILTGSSERITAVAFLMGCCIIAEKGCDTEEGRKNISKNMFRALEELGVHPMEVQIALDALEGLTEREENGDHRYDSD